MFRDKDACGNRKPKKIKISDSHESVTPISELLSPARHLTIPGYGIPSTSASLWIS